MFCSRCGKLISDDAQFCEKCGNRIHSNNNSENNNRKIPKQETLKKVFDLERYNRKKGLEQINTWLAQQPIKITKSFFKTYLGFFYSSLRITYAEFTYYTTNTNRRYMVDNVMARASFGKSGNQRLDDAQREFEAQHPNATVEYTFDRQIVIQGQPIQTRVLLYSYPIS